jgi:hypothetical protein
MMPLDGDSSARWTARAGSRARASSPLSQTKSITPFASARALIAESLSISASLTATRSLPRCRCGT